jgi:outer membrane lipoprotein SlyB
MEITTSKTLHPLTAIAAVSVTLFSLVGIGAITGLIPTSHSQTAQIQSAKPTDDPAKLAAVAPAAEATAVTESKPIDKPVAHKAAAKPAKPIATAAKPAEAPGKTANDSAPASLAQNDPAPGMMPPPGTIPPPPGAMPPPPPPAAAPPKPICHDCGVIESVREVEKKGDGSALGAIAGGVAGGLLGNQTGQGRGKSVMTVLGTIGGAFAGHEIEKNVNKVKSYEIAIRFDDGSSKVVTQNNPPAWRQGERVKLVDGVISPGNS